MPLKAVDAPFGQASRCGVPLMTPPGPIDRQRRLDRFTRHLGWASALFVFGLLFFISGILDDSGDYTAATTLGFFAVIGGVIWAAAAWSAFAATEPTGVREPETPPIPPAPSDAAPDRPNAPSHQRESAAPPLRPMIVRSTKKGIEITADLSGISVRHRAAGRRGTEGWRTRANLAWADIDTLVFDSDWRDPVVSLYAVCISRGPRVHLVDSRSITKASWEQLVSRIEQLTFGRLVIDLARRDDPGPDRFT